MWNNHSCRAARPQDKELLARLISLHHEAKDEAATQRAIKEFLALTDAKEGDYLRMARLREQWAEPQAALALLEAAAAAWPQSQPVKEALAAHLLSNDQKERGLKLYAELIKSGSMDEAIRAGQALMLRRETRAAQDMLEAREAEFAGEHRFLAMLIQAAMANKEHATAQRLTRARLLLDHGEEPTTAVRQSLSAWPDKASLNQLLAELQGKATLVIQERLLLAMLLHQLGMTDEAVKNLTAATNETELKFTLPMLITMHRAKLDLPKAIEAMEQLMALPSQRTAANLQQLVNLHGVLRDIPKAQALIHEWKKLAPSATTPWSEEAKLLRSLGKEAEALKVLRTATQRFDKDRGLATERARTLVEAGHLDEAMTAWQQLYDQTEDPAERLSCVEAMSSVAHMQKRMPSLIARFEDRQRSHRGSALAWLALAQLHRTTGNDENYRRCLYEASRLRPEDLALLTKIAECEEHSGLIKESLRTLEAAAKLDKTTKTKEAIARHHIEHGDADLGYAMLFALAGGDIMDARAVEQMGDALAEAAEWERATKFLAPYLSRFPADYRLHYLHAVALEESGRNDEAIRAFVSLLGMSNELPGVTAQPQWTAQPQPGYPPGIAEWQTLASFFHLAHQHRKKESNGSWQRYSVPPRYLGSKVSLRPAFVDQPPQVGSVGPFAVAHLHELAMDLGKEQRAALAEQMTEAGVADAALLLSLGFAEHAVSVSEEVLDQHPLDLRLHALWLTTVARQGAEPKHLERCFALFRDSYPDLAVRAGIAGIADSPLLQRELPELLRSLKEPSSGNWVAIETSIVDQGSLLDDRTQNELTDVLEEWSNRPEPEKATMSFATTLAACQIATQRWEKVLRALESAASPPADVKPAAKSIASQFGAGGDDEQRFAAPLTFSFAWLGLPPHPLMHRFVMPQNIDSSEANSALGEGLAALLPAVKNTALRALLELRYTESKEKSLEALIAQRMAKPKPTVEDRMLAAWIQQFLGNHAQACKHLMAAQGVATEKATQRTIDLATLWSASQITEEIKQPSNKLNAPVRAAMKRVLAGKLRPEMILQWAEHAKRIGFQDIAEELAKKTSTAPVIARGIGSWAPSNQLNPYSAGVVYRTKQRQPPAGPDPVLKLLAAGKRADAIQELKMQLGLLGDLWLDVQQYEQATYGLSGLRDSLKTKDAKLITEALTQLEAEAGEQAKPLGRIAALRDLLHEDAAAVAIYTKALAAGLNSPVAELRQRLLKQDEDAILWASLLKTPAPLQDSLLRRLTHPRENDSMFRVAYRLRKVKLATALLNQVAGRKRPLSNRLVSWLTALPEEISSQGRVGEQTFAGLFQRGEHRKEYLPFPRELRRAHDELCQALMLHPDTAPSGFASLTGLALAEKADTKALYATALDLLRKAKPTHTNSYAARVSFEDESNVARLNPQTFATLIAATTRGMEAFETEVRPLILRSSGRAMAEDMRAYAGVLTAVEADFPAAALRWLLPRGSAAQSQISSFGSRGRLDEVLRIWRQRALKCSMDEVMLASLKQPHSKQLGDEAKVYATELKARLGPQGLIDFVRKARDLALGADEPNRREAIKSYYARRQGRSPERQPTPAQQKSDQQASLYLNWLVSVLRAGHELELLPVIREDELLEQQGWLEEWASVVFASFANAGANEVPTRMTWLRALGFLGDSAQMRFYPLDRSGSATLFARMLEGTSAPLKLAAELEREKPRTLGVSLALAMVKRQTNGDTRDIDQSTATLFTAALTSHTQDIAAMSERSLVELDALLRVQFPDFSRAGDPALAKAVAPILEAVASMSSQQLDILLTTDSWNALPAEMSDPHLLCSRLSALARRDRPKGVQIFEKALALIAARREEIAARQRSGPMDPSLPSNQFLMNMSITPRLLPEIFEAARERGLMDSNHWCSTFASRLIGNDRSLSQPGEAKALLEHMAWLGTAEQFSDLPIENNWAPTMLLQFVGWLSDEQRTEALAEVQAIVDAAPPTFGRGWVNALLEAHSTRWNGGTVKAQPLIEFLATRQDLAKLSPSAAALMLATVKRILQQDKGLAAEPRTPSWRMHLEALNGRFHLARAEQLMAMKQPIEETQRDIQDCLSNVARINATKAKALLEHAIQLQEAADQAQRRLQRRQPHQTATAVILRDALRIPELHQMALQKLEAMGATKDVAWTWNAMQRAMVEGRSEQPAEDTVKLLRALKWLGSPADFDPMLPPAGTTGEQSVLQQWLPSGVSVALHQELSRGPRSFGSELLRCLSSPSVSKAGAKTDTIVVPQWTTDEVKALLAKPTAQKEVILNLVAKAVGTKELIRAHPLLEQWGEPMESQVLAESLKLVTAVVKAWRSQKADPTQESKFEGVEKRDGQTYIRVSYGDSDYERIGRACGQVYRSPKPEGRKAVEDLLDIGASRATESKSSGDLRAIEAMLINALIEWPAILPVVEQHAAKLGFNDRVNAHWNEALGSALIDSLSHRTVPTLMQAMQAASLLGDANSMPLRVGLGAKRGSAIAGLAKLLKNLPKQERAAIRTELAKLSPQRFGAALIDSFLQDRAAYERVITRHQTEVSALEADLQQVLLAAAKIAFD